VQSAADTASSNNDSGIVGQSTPQLQAGLPGGFSSAIRGAKTSIDGGLPLPPPQ